jgi:hypothetical protein
MTQLRCKLNTCDAMLANGFFPQDRPRDSTRFRDASASVPHHKLTCINRCSVLTYMNRCSFCSGLSAATICGPSCATRNRGLSPAHCMPRGLKIFHYAIIQRQTVLEASASRHVMPTHVLLKEYPRADSSKLFPRLNMQVLYLGNNTQQREQQKLRRRFTFTRESFNV